MNLPEEDGFDRVQASRDHKKLLIAALACGAVALSVLPFDLRILGVCNVAQSSSTLGFWRWFDASAPAVLLSATVILGVAVFLRASPTTRARRAGVALLVAFAVALSLTWVLKTGLGRHRPLADPHTGTALWSPLDLKDDRSFPSGHVCGATAICAAFWLALGGRGWLRNLVWLVPPLMMYDRVCLAVHWPSDVLGGAALGLASAALVGRLSRIPVLDRAASVFQRGGSPRLRFLLFVFGCLVVARFWRELPLGRDPVSGEVIEGFRTKPHWHRALAEPLVGPPLHVALEDVRSILWPTVAWCVAAVVALQKNRRLMAVAIVLPSFWLTWFVFGWSRPDRFVAKDRPGIFVDWHLHGDDPHDGRIDADALGEREEDREVSWAMLTHHSKTSQDPQLGAGYPPWRGVPGTEWSGVLPEKGKPWTAPHALVLGEKAVLDAANAAPTFLDAIRTASKGGALVIVAHYWRTEASVAKCPTFEEVVEAGAHGFEVGNRRRETDAEGLERLRDLDRKCREKGLLRFSFSDDHGVPSGSPCVTFLEGVGETELTGSGAQTILKRLREHDPGISVVPLLFFPGDPTLFPPRWLAPPVMAFEYLRSLRFLQQASWLVFAALVSLWTFGRR